jgi:signal transduction histidine kinase
MPASPEARRDLWWNKAAIVAAAVLAGVLAVLVFYLITTKLILSPVKQLKGLARQVAGGDLEARSELKTGDEFEELAVAFNEMLASLDESQEELRRTNISLDTRLGELAEANVALFEANKLKSEFLANVSHELRTPLTSIIGFAELLRDHPAGQEDRISRYVGNILGSGRMLLDLINDLLDLAKIEAGKLEVRISQVKLADICSDLVDFIRPLADKKQLDLVLDLPEEPPEIESDAGKIQQILYNLMSNAVKFTPARGRVRLAVDITEAGLVRIAVSDSGPGIPEEQRPDIFEKFRQIDASVTREHGGTGLGLAISKELTAMLGGTISVTSKAGEGATFTIELPKKAPVQNGRPLIRLT